MISVSGKCSHRQNILRFNLQDFYSNISDDYSIQTTLCLNLLFQIVMGGLMSIALSNSSSHNIAIGISDFLDFPHLQTTIAVVWDVERFICPGMEFTIRSKQPGIFWFLRCICLELIWK
jgi:hypothetical protein